jgi:hypothetical protein
MRRYIVFTAIILAGCAGHSDVWDKRGGTSAQFQQDYAGCKMAALYAPQYAAPRLPQNYVASTTYNGNYSQLGGFASLNGTANTTIQSQPSTAQGVADIATAIGNRERRIAAVRYCMEAKGYSLRKQ